MNLTHLTRLFQSKTLKFSSLAEVMNQRPKLNVAQSLRKANHGLFQIPELRSFEGFAEMKEQCLAQVKELVEEATSERRNRKLVDIFDDLSDSLCKAAHVFEFIRIAHPAVSYIHAAGESSHAVEKLVEQLNLNGNLYEALKKVLAYGDFEPMDEVESRVANLFLSDFEKTGLDLPGFKRRKLAGLNEAVSTAAREYTAGTAFQKVLPSGSVPENILYAFPQDKRHVTLSNFQWYSHISDVREASYRLYYKFCPVQEKRLSKLLGLRHALANTFGSSSYAEHVLKGNLLGTPGQVDEFLKTMSVLLEKSSEYEFDLMRRFKREETCSKQNVRAWDVLYYSEEIRERYVGLKKSDYLPYFSLGVCVQGLSEVFRSLYGITLKNVSVKAGETWAPDVYKLVARHPVEGDLGYIYCDLFARRNKRKPVGQFNVRCGKRMANGNYQVPITVIMMNLPLPHSYEPTLVESECLDKLFNLIGHAVHGFLGRSFFQHVSDSRDSSPHFVDVAARLTEHFSSDPRILKSFSKHYGTKKTIPEDTLERFCVKKSLFSANRMQFRILLSLLDQSYHSKHPLPFTPTQIFKKEAGNCFQGQYVEDTAPHLRFVEFEKQGGCCCSELVSEALAALIWNKHFKEDPFKRVNGDLLSRCMLAYGTGKSAGDVLRDLLNLEVTPRILAEELAKAVVSNVELGRTFLAKNGLDAG